MLQNAMVGTYEPYRHECECHSPPGACVHQGQIETGLNRESIILTFRS